MGSKEKTDEKALAKKLSEPLESSAERSKKSGNTHPIKPEDREYTASGNTNTVDELAALYTQQNLLNERIKEAEIQKNKLENSELYQRDLKVFEMSKGGRLPGQNVGQAATESEEDRAAAELKQLDEFEDRIKKGETLNEDDKKKHTELKARATAKKK